MSIVNNEKASLLKALEYPVDLNILIRKKKQIKDILMKNAADMAKMNIAVLGGSTTSQIKDMLELFLLKNNIQPFFYESGYNRFYEAAVFENPALSEFKPDIIYIHTSVKNILYYPDMADSDEKIEELLIKELERYRTAWKALDKYRCPVIQNNFELPEYRVLGNLSCVDPHGRTHFINRLNAEFSVAAKEINYLYINDINYLSASIGLQTWFDKRLWYMAKYAMSHESMTLIAQNISGIISAITGRTKKCIVLDLDNTCWGGVIGDDGIDNIILGPESPAGEAYSEFQKYLKSMKNRGVLLAACSKNELQNAKEGFSKKESILQVEDFSAFKANWELKSRNISEIADELNIGLDSLVFLDDNPAERDAVKSALPDVAVPEIGDDVTEYINHSDKNVFFETVSLSKDDSKRNEYYETNRQRNMQAEQYSNYNDFLESLQMYAEIGRFSDGYLNRITQLINKTNQFNLTTRRYAAPEVKKMMNSDKHITLYGKLTDKFGENGLISIMIGDIKDSCCHINLWVMSCRVFQRNMEFAMLDSFVAECRLKGISTIVGYYFKSPKNSIVATLFETCGFRLLEKKGDDSVWELSVSDYKNKNKLIKVNNE